MSRVLPKRWTTRWSGRGWQWSSLLTEAEDAQIFWWIFESQGIKEHLVKRNPTHLAFKVSTEQEEKAKNKPRMTRITRIRNEINNLHPHPRHPRNPRLILQFLLYRRTVSKDPPSMVMCWTNLGSVEDWLMMINCKNHPWIWEDSSDCISKRSGRG